MHHPTGRDRGEEKLRSKDSGKKPNVTSRTGVEGGKSGEIVFLQLSDIHLDRQYSEVRYLRVSLPFWHTMYMAVMVWHVTESYSNLHKYITPRGDLAT